MNDLKLFRMTRLTTLYISAILSRVSSVRHSFMPPNPSDAMDFINYFIIKTSLFLFVCLHYVAMVT